MKQITGEEFVGLIEENPSWCKTIKEPLEITTVVNLPESKITHLSPLITFSGRDYKGWVANFRHLKNLKVAIGTFHGFVDFSYSEIEKIENLIVTGEQIGGFSASFDGCKNLKIATGTFKGPVFFEKAGITTIKNLIIENPGDGTKGYFEATPIKYAPQEYRGGEYTFDKGVIKNSIKKDKITKEAINKIKSEANNIEI